jgi:hypothetical protein
MIDHWLLHVLDIRCGRVHLSYHFRVTAGACEVTDWRRILPTLSQALARPIIHQWITVTYTPLLPHPSISEGNLRSISHYLCHVDTSQCLYQPHFSPHPHFVSHFTSFDPTCTTLTCRIRNNTPSRMHSQKVRCAYSQTDEIVIVSPLAESL